MAQYNELPVYKATYDLLLAIFQFTKEFSKEYKYTVGESLKKKLLIVSLYRENKSKDKELRWVTKCSSNKGFSGISSVLPRIKFCVGGQVSSPQSLTTATLSRYQQA